MVVLDTSFLVGYHNERDAHHAAAARALVQMQAGVWGPALLLEYVFLEVVTVIAARRGLEQAVRAGRTLLAARELTFVPCSELFLDAWMLFREQRETTLSLADAAIVVAARREPPGRILTFDTDFQAVQGVTVLPGEDSLGYVPSATRPRSRRRHSR